MSLLPEGLIAGSALLLCGALLGFLLGVLRGLARQRELAVALEGARVRLSGLEEQLERRSAALDDDTRLRSAFDSAAREALQANSELFLKLAREALGREQALGAGALKERELAIAQLVEPLRAAVEQTQSQLAALERDRRDAFATLRTQIESLAGGQAQLARETRNLVTALRRPEVRGRWGELTLRRVVELAGMVEHCDFTEQPQLSSGAGSLRPDLVVHMPDARDLVVDVKTPLDAYLEALEAPSEEARALALERHARVLEERVRELAAKRYWSQFERSPEFVVLFLPGDQFLSAALTERPELLERAFEQAVILATPSTLMALLKSIAYAWRQATVAQHAEAIRELAAELYRGLAVLHRELAKLGQRIGSTVEAYNATLGSLERHVLPAAQRFPELGATAQPALASLDPVSALARREAALARPEGRDAEAFAADALHAGER